jgi:hypothetical protein
VVLFSAGAEQVRGHSVVDLAEEAAKVFQSEDSARAFRIA